MTTSGPTKTTPSSSLEKQDQAELLERIRTAAGVEPGEGPSNHQILSAIEGFKGQFDYWYTRVMREAVPKYRKLIIRRINPFIRRIEFSGLAAPEAGRRLVGDYRNRVFVTAGGWALERMAVKVCVDGHKSPTRGIDIERYEDEEERLHTYILKSGTVTRNSDIIAALKTHSREAQARFKQGGASVSVIPNYAIAAGRTASTFVDGIRRPSSGEFWSEMMGLDQSRALDLALVMAEEAGHLADVDASRHVRALEVLVVDYIGRGDDPSRVDWDHIADVTMRVRKVWRKEDAARHERAMEVLNASGYDIDEERKRVSEEEEEAAAEIAESDNAGAEAQ